MVHRLIISLIAIALSGTAVTHTAAASPPKRPPVASDCSVDVADAFNSWLATVPNGSTINLARRGCYLSNGSIAFKNKGNITIRGHRAIIRASGEPACPEGYARNALGYCVVAKNPDGGCPVGTREFSATDCAAFIVRAQLWFERGAGIVVRDPTVQGSNGSVRGRQLALQRIRHPELPVLEGGRGSPLRRRRDCRHSSRGCLAGLRAWAGGRSEPAPSRAGTRCARSGAVVSRSRQRTWWLPQRQEGGVRRGPGRTHATRPQRARSGRRPRLSQCRERTTLPSECRVPTFCGIHADAW